MIEKVKICQSKSAAIKPIFFFLGISLANKKARKTLAFVFLETGKFISFQPK
jgi:hypothetical protein